MEVVEIERQCKEMLNQLIFRSRNFCDMICVPDGLMDILMVYSMTGDVPQRLKYSKKLSYDYDYFTFVKSTKSLLAIRELLRNKEYTFTEDCFMLIRSIFENHILSRYVRDNIDTDEKRKEVVDNFILAPLGVSFDYYVSHGKKGVFSKDNKKIGDIKNPSWLIMGKERDYYHIMYPFLCQYTHCSYGALPCYFTNQMFTYNGNKFRILTYILAIFVFTKIYEGVVTVNGEDLGSTKDMKLYYDLAYDSLEFQIKVIDYLIDYYKKIPKEEVNIVIEKYIGVEAVDNSNSKIVNMLEKMKESLFDEIGSIDKSAFIDNKFVRKYQEW